MQTTSNWNVPNPIIAIPGNQPPVTSAKSAKVI